MNKPSWDDAPEWANFLAMDADGEWCWHEKKPNAGDGLWIPGLGKWKVVKVPAWEETLEAKP